MGEDEKQAIAWTNSARFLPMPIPEGMSRTQLDKILRKLEREGYIYYTRVDGKKCHRLLTAAGAKVLDEYKKEQRDGS
jgi:hypothetical protein